MVPFWVCCSDDHIQKSVKKCVHPSVRNRCAKAWPIMPRRIQAAKCLTAVSTHSQGRCKTSYLDVFLPYIRKTELCACNWCVVVPFDRGKGQKAQQSRSTLVDSRRCYSRTGSDTKLKVWWLNNQVSVYAWCEFQRILFGWSRIKICERSETPKFWIFRFLGIAVLWKPICGKRRLFLC